MGEGSRGRGIGLTTVAQTRMSFRPAPPLFNALYPRATPEEIENLATKPQQNQQSSIRFNQCAATQRLGRSIASGAIY